MIPRCNREEGNGEDGFLIEQCQMGRWLLKGIGRDGCQWGEVFVVAGTSALIPRSLARCHILINVINGLDGTEPASSHKFEPCPCLDAVLVPCVGLALFVLGLLGSECRVKSGIDVDLWPPQVDGDGIRVASQG